MEKQTANATLTKHAEMRFRQRGIREEALNCLEKFGEARTGPGGITKIFLSRRSAKLATRDLKKLIRTIEHAGGITVMSNGDRAITGYRQK